MARLLEIEEDLAVRQGALESAALQWFRLKRDKEHAWAVAYISADGPAHQRKAIADRETAMVGKNEEALFEALKAVVRTLEARASIGQTLLRSQGRVT
jgi:hypothetical protein